MHIARILRWKVKGASAFYGRAFTAQKPPPLAGNMRAHISLLDVCVKKIESVARRLLRSSFASQILDVALQQPSVGSSIGDAALNDFNSTQTPLQDLSKGTYSDDAPTPQLSQQSKFGKGADGLSLFEIEQLQRLLNATSFDLMPVHTADNLRVAQRKPSRRRLDRTEPVIFKMIRQGQDQTGLGRGKIDEKVSGNIMQVHVEDGVEALSRGHHHAMGRLPPTASSPSTHQSREEQRMSAYQYRTSHFQK